MAVLHHEFRNPRARHSYQGGFALEDSRRVTGISGIRGHTRQLELFDPGNIYHVIIKDEIAIVRSRFGRIVADVLHRNFIADPGLFLEFYRATISGAISENGFLTIAHVDIASDLPGDEGILFVGRGADDAYFFPLVSIEEAVIDKDAALESLGFERHLTVMEFTSLEV
jgi:hypothetical protein